MYMPDVKNLHSLLRNIKSSARKRNSLSVEIWNEILQEVGIPNEESFFKSKGDNWKVPDKPYRYLREDRYPVEPMWPGSWFILHYLSVKIDLKATENSVLANNQFYTLCLFMSHFFCCSECCAHFGLMTNIFNEKEKIQDRQNFIQPKNNENFKLLMWRLHNTVNSRHLDRALDKFGNQDVFPKVQFPAGFDLDDNSTVDSGPKLNSDGKISIKEHFWPLYRDLPANQLNQIDDHIFNLYNGKGWE